MNIWNNDTGWLPGFLEQASSVLGSQLGYAGDLEGQRQAGINQFLSSVNPGNTEAEIMRMGRINRGLAGDDARESAAMMRSQGLGSGAIGGGMDHAYNQGANATNKYAADQLSPEGQKQRLLAFLGAIGEGQSMPMMNPMTQAQGQWTNIWQILEELKRQKKPGILGQILGTGLGMAAPGLSSWASRQIGGGNKP